MFVGIDVYLLVQVYISILQLKAALGYVSNEEIYFINYLTCQ